jgi:hypothetical protein
MRVTAPCDGAEGEELRASRNEKRISRMRISREAVKSGCAREWGGWGRLSDDGPGQNNPDRKRGPLG